MTRSSHLSLVVAVFLGLTGSVNAQPLITAGVPAQLDIRQAGEHSIRVTLKPVDFKEDFPFTPALADRNYPKPLVSLREVIKPIKKKIGELNVNIHANPLTLIITNANGETVQELVFLEDGRLSFKISDQPVLGLGEGGPKPGRDVNWRNLPIEFDRRGRLFKMQPRWQADAYGSRNPVAMLIGTEGWGLFVASPWVMVDLEKKDGGYFIPWKPTGEEANQQNQKNQNLNQGKGLPPIDKIVPGLYDFFVFDAHHPEQLMKDISVISGPAVMPPKWSLGYMQSHRTLEDEKQMINIVETFRSKQIPIDAVIYLGTGFCPRGWNTEQPSFDFNPEVFKRQPKDVINDLHDRHVRVAVHIVPWDRDKLPSLHGSIPPRQEEILDPAHIKNYWEQHVGLSNAGIDAFWPDEGDWFNLYERIKRHQLYYQGPLSTQSNIRPWSLHRNGHLGIAQWGGWVWSGDTESTWKTLEGQIAVGMNHSLSLSPFWGSDIGGFYPTEEYTGELYVRWHQFASFNASFRSHGRTWWTHLPWGWGLSEMGPKENKINPSESELNNPAIEPIAKKYSDLHYQLMPYTYTLAWEARDTGMPPMRAMWLHYPDDKTARNIGSQFLWGRDLLIAPVFKKGATLWNVYLPPGDWYDWWTNKKESGGQSITRKVDLATMPIYVKAGAIIPFDPVKQYTNEISSEPMTIKVYRGANGLFTLYEDDGISQEYLQGIFNKTRMTWNDKTKELMIEPTASKSTGLAIDRMFKIELLPEGTIRNVNYTGRPVTVTF